MAYNYVTPIWLEEAGVVAKYQSYAESIGCAVVQDEIQCTAEQAKKLLRWWEVNVNGIR